MQSRESSFAGGEREQTTPGARVPFLRGMRAAFVFLTRVPVGGFPYTRADWRWSTAHFPLVGLALGSLQGATYVILHGVGPLGAAALAIGLSLLVTGAFHEDGLADTSDALGGAYDRENVLRILKDSRVGSFGAVALCFSFVTRAALLGRFPASAPTLGLVAFVGAWARTVPLWQMVLLPYATARDGKSRDVTRAGATQAAVATLYPAVAGGLLSWSGALPLDVLVRTSLIGTAVGGVTVLRYRARVGGITGDFLGATEQLCEVAALASLVWRPR